ncbi:MAG: MTH1187 family thiamine-binding protein [Bacillota bacterium]
MAIVEISIVPLGTGSTSLSPYVAACEKVLRENSGDLKYELTAMGTILEGDLDQIMTLVRRLHEVPFDQGARRVSTSIKIDDRRDRPGTIEQKVKSVEEKLEK